MRPAVQGEAAGRDAARGGAAGCTRGCMMNEAVQRFFYRIDRTPEREAVFDSSTGIRYTYGELGRRARKLAAFLTEDLGLRTGDVMALAADSCIAYVDAFYASCLTGIVVTTYNCHLRACDTAPLVLRERPRALLTSQRHREKMGTCLSQSGVSCTVVVLDGGGVPSGDPASCTVSYDAVMARSDAGFEPVDVDAEQTAMLVHTGGTTGLPKSAMISYRAVFYNALSELLTAGMGATDKGIIFLPFFHTAGWNSAMLPLLLAGGRVVLTPTLDPGVLLRLIREERPTVGVGIEAIFRRMADHPDFVKTDLSCYVRLTNGASAISSATMDAYWKRGVKILNAYGMTETGPNNCYPPANDLTMDDVRARWSTVGKPMYFSELKVERADGSEADPGEDGELLWRGPVTFSGYWENLEATAEAITPDGFVRSGDIGHLDVDGYVHLQGRKKHMIISCGENVFPIEIENVLKEHPDVEECYVIAVPDDQRGEVGKAIVGMRDGATFDREALAAFACERLSTIKVPKYFTPVREFPRAGMKVSLARLQELYGFAGD